MFSLITSVTEVLFTRLVAKPYFSAVGSSGGGLL
jgi:hypothetical protein